MEADQQTVQTTAYVGNGSARHRHDRPLRLAIWCTLAATMVINVLALTGPLYALEIYDRVLPSGSGPSLVAFTLLALILYAALASLDHVRLQVIARAGVEIAAELPPSDRPRFEALALKGTAAHVLDLGWTPFYAALAFALHPALGSALLASVLVLAVTTALLDRRRQRFANRREPAITAHPEAVCESARLQSAERCAMARLEAADAASALSAATKFIRLCAQSGVLGLSALLAMNELISVGTIMAMSVILSRALAPIDPVITAWPSLSWALCTWRNRRKTEEHPQAREARTPSPEAAEEPGLVVDHVKIGRLPPLSFNLRSGDALGVIGTTGSGKSRLLEMLAGIHAAGSADIRLHGKRLQTFSQPSQSHRIGFLSQCPVLPNGKISEIISRFDPHLSSEALKHSAHRARIATLIEELPHGFETEIVPAHISPGLRQRLALARALYGTPDLVLLDEPFSNMDHDGDQAVLEAIADLRAEGAIVIVVAHRLSALEPVNLALVLSPGIAPLFGPKDAILRTGVRSVPSFKPSRRDAS